MAKNEKMTTISSDRLRYAREYYGLDVYQAAQKIRTVTPDDITDYEDGKDYPTYSKLEMMANLYNRPMLFFFFKSQPQQDRLAVAFRSIEREIGQHFNMQIRLIMEKADLYRLNIAELYNTQNHPKFSSLLEENGVKSDKDFIKWLRFELDLSLDKQKKFNRSVDFLEHVRDKLYEIGIYIFKDSFKSNEVSGVCLYDDEFPVILLNNKTTFTRQIFTVFHEIYHLFYKEPDVYVPELNEEKACDKFASEFLIPDDDFSSKLIGINNFEDNRLIDDLAREYTVSPSAIAYRLKTKGMISSSFYKTIHIDGSRKMNSESSGGNFYYTRMSYMGKQYLKKVFSEYYTGRINTASVGKYTGLKAAHISKLSSYMFGGEF
jgi:Zn-dependent peptidase ImmA (M78 family)